MKDERHPGDYCSISTCPELLIAVNGAVVCPVCDAVADWPNVKRGQAEIEK